MPEVQHLPCKPEVEGYPGVVPREFVPVSRELFQREGKGFGDLPNSGHARPAPELLPFRSMRVEGGEASVATGRGVF